MNVLLVEPQIALARRIRRDLEIDDFLVTSCFQYEEVLISITKSIFDFVILNFDLAHHQVDQIISKIRAIDKDCKIVGIGNQSIFDVAETLYLGVDDYINKINIAELRIRINLLKRRTSPTNIDQSFSHGDFVFKEGLSLLQYKDKEITLTKKERLILFELFRTQETIETETLIQKIWLDEMLDGYKRLSYHLSVLKKKIKQISDQPLIQNIKGRGYRLA